ncbi:MAG: glycosyltransferase, partial [Planctomycetota bacterium]|nr:glycosyltransferase [Planctomycetota bacterium]
MRVLILIDKMPVAGSQRHVARLALGLRPRGIEVSICCLDAIGAEGERLRASGIEVHNLVGSGPAAGLGLRAWLRLTRLLEEQKPDVLHTVLFDANLIGPLAAAAVGRRPAVVASRRDTGFALRRHHWLALRLANRYVDIFCANSEAVRQAMISGEGVAAARIRLIPNGIDISLWQNASSLRPEMGLAENDFVVICVARLRPEKRHDLLLRAVALLQNEQPPVKLLLAGDGPEEEKLRRLAADLGLAQRVLFLGQRQDIAALLATADAAALLSASEGLANAVLEAMAAGKPVVA